MKAHPLVLAMALMNPMTGTAYAMTAEQQIMVPINGFLDALSKRDKVGMLIEVVPDVQIMSERNNKIRRLSVEQIGNIITRHLDGQIAEPLQHAVIHIDRTIATVWASYDFIIDGKLDHCGTDAITLLKIDDRWRIVGLADNARKDCG